MKSVSSFINTHQKSTIVVCGCGESLSNLERPERFIANGVNDVGRRFQPIYLIVVNPPNQVSGERFEFFKTSNADCLFTELELPINYPNIGKCKLGAFGGMGFLNENVFKILIKRRG
jgi:hypothetical protein